MFTYLKAWLGTYAKSERGVTIVEYAVMLTFITVALIAIITTLSTTVRGQFQAVINAILGTP